MADDSVETEHRDADFAAFVGPNYSSYYQRKWKPVLAGEKARAGFNWPALLLIPIWLAYRKMYGLTACFYVAIVVVAYLDIYLLENSVRYVNIVIAVISGLYANVWYLNHTTAEVARARAEGAPLQVLSGRGGTSVGAAVGSFALFCIAIVALGFVNQAIGLTS